MVTGLRAPAPKANPILSNSAEMAAFCHPKAQFARGLAGCLVRGMLDRVLRDSSCGRCDRLLHPRALRYPPRANGRRALWAEHARASNRARGQRLRASRVPAGAGESHVKVLVVMHCVLGRTWRGRGRSTQALGVCARVEDLRPARNGAWKASRHGTATARSDSAQPAGDLRTMMGVECASASARRNQTKRCLQPQVPFIILKCFFFVQS